MDKATSRSVFVNDGSFMERFKQLQEEKEQKSEVLDKSRSGSSTLITSTPKTVINKTTIEFKARGSQKITQAPSSGKLAFSLKQKSRLVAPAVKFGEDEDEDEDDRDAGNSSDDGPMKRPKLGQFDVSDQLTGQVDVAYYLSPYQHWWKEMFTERFGKYGTPATRVIYVQLFMLLVLISSLSEMQHHLPQVILQ